MKINSKYVIKHNIVDLVLVKNFLQVFLQLNQVLLIIMFLHGRFKDAQKPLEKCLDIVEKNIVCGVHTWPGTQIIIEETRPGKLQVWVI